MAYLGVKCRLVQSRTLLRSMHCKSVNLRFLCYQKNSPHLGVSGLSLICISVTIFYVWFILSVESPWESDSQFTLNDSYKFATNFAIIHLFVADICLMSCKLEGNANADCLCFEGSRNDAHCSLNQSTLTNYCSTPARHHYSANPSEQHRSIFTPALSTINVPSPGGYVRLLLERGATTFVVTMVTGAW